jgi:hypothetical protein
MLAGRLTGSLDGRPVVIEADDSGLVLTTFHLRTAWAARGLVRPLLPILGILRGGGVPVRIRIAGLASLEVLPRPSALASILAPGLASLAREWPGASSGV